MNRFSFNYKFVYYKCININIQIKYYYIILLNINIINIYIKYKYILKLIKKSKSQISVFKRKIGFVVTYYTITFYEYKNIIIICC